MTSFQPEKYPVSYELSIVELNFPTVFQTSPHNVFNHNMIMKFQKVV